MSWQTIHDAQAILKQIELTTIQKYSRNLTPSSLGNRWPPSCEALPSDDDAEQRNSNGQRLGNQKAGKRKRAVKEQIGFKSHELTEAEKRQHRETHTKTREANSREQRVEAELT